MPKSEPHSNPRNYFCCKVWVGGPALSMADTPIVEGIYYFIFPRALSPVHCSFLCTKLKDDHNINNKTRFSYYRIIICRICVLCSIKKKSHKECQNRRWLKVIAIYCCVLILSIANLLKFVSLLI